MNASNLPHRRQNLLTGEWILVSPQRMQRPWQGERKKKETSQRPRHDPDCYLCPGNERAGGARNPNYTGCHVFDNDFPALLEDAPGCVDAGLFQQEPARGEAKVICYSPDHSLTLARLSHANRLDVINTWCRLSEELGNAWSHVQIFENNGAMMGASSPHPHGQVWASDFVPSRVDLEDQRQRAYYSSKGSAMLADVRHTEEQSKERVVAENQDWLAIVPHWAAWPFELLLLPKTNIRRLEELNDPKRESLSQIMQSFLGAYDALFDTDFPYSMGWHGPPHALGDDTKHWLLHAHFFPPLLRSASIRKHMVGFELMAENQRDLTPEAAAQRLREVLT